MGKAILDKRVQPGMVFHWSNKYPDKIVKEIREDEVVVYEFDGTWSCSCGYGWFETGRFEFVRQIGVREFNRIF